MSENRSLVFFIHGFMGHPNEFGPLIHFLEEKGFDTHRFSLPEHGDEPGNIGATHWEEMLACCQAELDECRQQYDSIHLIGFSLGGALSVLLARQNPEVFQTVTLVAAPYKSVFNIDFGHYHFRNFFNRFLPGTQFLHQSDTGYPKPVFYPIDFLRFYLQMDYFFTEVREAARELMVPTLLIHSQYDITVPYEHSEWLFEAIPGEKNFLTLLNCGHQVFPHNVSGVVEESVLQHLSMSPLQRHGDVSLIEVL